MTNLKKIENNSIHLLANQLVNLFGDAIRRAHRKHLDCSIPNSVSLKLFVDKRFSEIHHLELSRLVNLARFWVEFSLEMDGNRLIISNEVKSDFDKLCDSAFEEFFFIDAYDNLTAKLHICKLVLPSRAVPVNSKNEFKAMFNYHVIAPRAAFVAYGYFRLHSDGSINFLLRELDPLCYKGDIFDKLKSLHNSLSDYERFDMGLKLFDEKREKHLLTLSKCLGSAGIQTMIIDGLRRSDTIKNKDDFKEGNLKIIKKYCKTMLNR